MSDGKVTLETELDSKGFESGLGKLNSIAGGAGKLVTAGVTAAAGAVAKLTKEVVANYGEYEQMEGGIKKLYGNMGMSLEEYATSVGKSTSEVQGEWQRLEDAQNLVLQNADNAYKTAGMSANKYLETATSFSGALITSLNGDTVQAAKLTDVAMRAISDNWNTFGGDLGSISYAFQGFAKGNYTMLDNLKLGYGGTQEQMKKLVHDASQMTDIQAELNETVEDGSLSFDNIVKAIDVVQKKQNIWGTTAREASTTIQGSLNMTKSAWDDLLTAFGNPKIDAQALSDKIDHVIDSAEITLENMMPVIERALEGIGRAIEKLAPIISEKLPGIMQAILPSLIAAASNLAGTFAANLPSILSVTFTALKEQGTSGLLVAFGGIMAISDKVAGDAFIAFKPVSTAIGKAVSEIEWKEVSSKIGTGLSNAMAGLDIRMSQFKFNGEQALKPVISGISGAFGKVSSAIMPKAAGIAETIGGAFASLGPRIGGIVSGIGSAFSTLGTVMTGPVGIAIAIIGALVGMFVLLYNTNEDFRNAMNESGAQILAALQPIGEAFTNMLNEIMPILQELGTYILEQFTQVAISVGEAIAQLMVALAPLITMVVETLIPVIMQLAEAFIPIIMNLIQQLVPIITSLVSAIMPIIEMLISALVPVITTIMEVITQVVNIIVAILVPVIQVITTVIVGILQVLTPVIEFILGNVVVAIQVVIDIIRIIIGVLTGDFSGAADAFNDILQKISDWWNNIWGNISSFFQGIWDTITGFLSGAMDGIKNTIHNGIDGVINFFTEMPGRIVSAVQGFGGMLVEAGKNIIHGFLDGLKAGFEAVKDFVGGIGEWIASHKGPKEYDLHLLRNAGNWIMQSLEWGLNKGSEGVYDKIESIGDSIKEKMEDVRIPITDMLSFDDYAMQNELKAGLDSSIATLNALYSASLLGQAQNQAQVVPATGPTLNFYANEFSPEAIYQKMHQADTYGFARSY